MANVAVFNMEGKEVGTLDLSDAVFGVEVNEHLVHMAVVWQLANKRQGTQKAKTRSEVSGGGRKPWRQKGTGHARQGSTRSPQWTGGGVVFAPVPRDYSFKLNKKEKSCLLYTSQPGYQGYYPESPYQGTPIQPAGPEEPMKISDWIVTLLVLSIPCVGLVMLFVWGFSGTENQSRANFCKAALIWSAILLVLAFIFYMVVLAGVISGLG